jgi:endonuclease V-like protein UPF0215 family
MGTTDNFDVPAAATLAETDQYASINGTTTRGAYVTGAQLRRFSAGGLVSAAAATLAVSAATHAGRTVLLSKADGIAVTLPAATGSGDVYRFVVGVAASGGSYVIGVTANDIFYGNIIANSTADSPDLAQPWPTAANSNVITLNGGTTGGLAIGDFVQVQDIATDKWAVYGVTTCNSTEATPFSNA